ncbi:kinase-like domain-containing protein [Apiospora arundinis]|uniref:EKC/KEOPS complex subunit BUD32 n=1 Tax=Apiospora arundinis TaxID=335852 RepID=A0ABR2HKC9_9PEZI
MTDHLNTPNVEGIPTVKAFNDLAGLRYYCDPDLSQLYSEMEFENPEDYQPGGLCPIDISVYEKSSFIAGRFQVIHKLGFGGFGSVWLCYEAAAKKWRAVKVSRASLASDNNGELIVNSVMSDRSVTVAEALEHQVVLPLETFWIESINGKHLCTVLPLLGPRLSDWSTWKGKDDVDTVRRISLEMVEGMNFLHGHGICHGDFRPQNILMQLNEDAFDGIDADNIYEILEAPAMVDILLRNDGSKSPYSPDMLVSSLDWNALGRFVSDKIAIVDFGESYLSSSSDTRPLGIPGNYAAPEVLLGGQKGIGTDIYALGRTIMDFRLKECVMGDAGNYWRFKWMETLMGPCPPPFRENALERFGAQEKNADEDSESPDVPDSETMDTISYVIRSAGQTVLGDEYDHPINCHIGKERYRFKLSSDEVGSLGGLLQNLFRWQPEERWDTDRILAHRWFTEKHTPVKSCKPEWVPDNEPATLISVGYDHNTTGSSNRAASTDNTIDSLESRSDAQQVLPRQKTAWTCLQMLGVVFYLIGALATIAFFLAHMLANQPGFYAERQMVSSHELTSLVSTVVEYVIVIFILQE